MDQLTAYKVLGLEPGASPEEVKEAYATLSKKYHPEEHPEEFQKIHDAYATLARGRRAQTTKTTYSEWDEQEERSKQPEFRFEEVVVENQQPQESGNPLVEEMQEYDFERIKAESVKVEEPVYAFEEAEARAEWEEQQRLHELVLEAVAELKVLVSPKYKNDVKAYKTFFEDNKYQPIIRRADFLHKLCDALEDSKLKKSVYDYIIEFYRMRGRDLTELSEVGLRLYQILDQKAGMKKPVNAGVYGGILAGLFAGLRGLRPVLRGNSIFVGILTLAVIAFVVFLIYKKLRERQSIFVVQGAIAIMIALSQFIVIMFDLYGKLFGSIDNGNTVAVVIMLLSLIWFILVLLAFIMKAVIGFIKRK